MHRNMQQMLRFSFVQRRPMQSGIGSQSVLSTPCEVPSSLGAHAQLCSRLPTAGSRAPGRTWRTLHNHAKAPAAIQQAEERASSHSEASTSSATTSEPILTRKQSQQSVADKLIDLFATKSPDEWRKLIAFSKQWSSLVDRCEGPIDLVPYCPICLLMGLTLLVSPL